MSSGLLFLAAMSAILLWLSFQAVKQQIALWSIPGPIWARFTDLWRFYYQNRPGYVEKIVTLHQKHGKLVRLGPNFISICDPAAIPVIYSTNPPWQKGPSYYGAVPVSKTRAVPSIIAMSEVQHSAIRKAVGRAFTTNSLLDYEDAIEADCTELVRALGQLPEADIGLWLQFFAMDMIIRIAFGQDLGLLRHGNDTDGTLAAVVARFDHWNRWAAMPFADYLLNKSWLAVRLQGLHDSPLAKVARSKLQVRVINSDASCNDLCSKFIKGQAKYPDLVKQDEILGIIMSTIGAGSDTTAATLTYTFIFLAKNILIKEKLMQELQEKTQNGSLSNPPKWPEVNKLPYLDAVLRESMRLLPIPAWSLDRIVPPSGAVISGRIIPGGTVVACQIDALQLDKDVFGGDSHLFRPERWLDVSEDQRRQMERAFLVFGAGKRTCTGIHIAWLEMKKALPALLLAFDFELADPDFDMKKGIRVSAVKYPPKVLMKIKKRSQ